MASEIVAIPVPVCLDHTMKALRHPVIQALLAAGITIVAGLTIAFQGEIDGEPITQFSQISEVAYALVGLGGLATFLNDLRSQHRDPPA